MKKTAILVVLLTSLSTQAKYLSAECNSEKDDKTFIFSRELGYENLPGTVNLTVNGTKIDNLKDVSPKPYFQNWDIHLIYKYGKNLRSSVDITLHHCEMQFGGAEGVATLNEYNVESENIQQTDLICSCFLH